MLRPASSLIFALALQVALAQQVESHGPAASVLSPTSPGVAHATPSSVVSPTPRFGPNGRIVINQRHFRVRFGDPRIRHARREFVPVPIFIPAYPIDGNYTYVDSDMAASEQNAGADAVAAPSGSDSEALREAYLRGARDALAQQADSRYGEHYLDAREKAQSKPPATTNQPRAAKEAAPESESANTTEEPSAKEQPAENTPSTVFIFKDGHKLETQNYAIVGQTLFDFSNNAMKKIKLDDLDLDATRKVNDELGISVKLPPSP